MQPAHRTDVAIIGAGPAGMFAAFELGMLKIRSLLIDALPELGGQCTALYPEKPIYDIPAHAAISGGDLISELERQIAPFHVPRLLGCRVVALSGAAGDFVLATEQGMVHAKAVIIAAGAGAFGPNRPPLAGLDAYERSGAVRYAVRRREDMRGKHVVIAGGGDSAVDWALALDGIAASVKFVHRRAKFRAAPESIDRLTRLAETGAVELVVPYVLDTLHGADGVLQAVGVASLDGDARLLEADVLLPFFGLSTELGPIAEWSLALERQHLAITPATCETSRPGIFAIGDVASYPGKLKQILQGFSEAAMAAHAIHPLVFPDVALHFQHSTTSGVPGA